MLRIKLSFLYKNISWVVWTTSAPFFPSLLHNLGQASFLTKPWWVFSLLFWSFDQSQNLSFVRAFSVVKYLPEFLSWDVSAGIISSSFSCQTRPSFMSVRALIAVPVAAGLASSVGRRTGRPIASSLFSNPIPRKVYFQILSAFISSLHFLLCWPVSSFSCSFW